MEEEAGPDEVENQRHRNVRPVGGSSSRSCRTPPRHPAHGGGGGERLWMLNAEWNYFKTFFPKVESR